MPAAGKRVSCHPLNHQSFLPDCFKHSSIILYINFWGHCPFFFCKRIPEFEVPCVGVFWLVFVFFIHSSFVSFIFLVGEPVTFQRSTFAVWSLRKNGGPVSALSLRKRLPSLRRHKKENLISQQHKDTNYSKARPCKIKPTIKSKRLKSRDPISDYPRSPTEALPKLELPGHVHYLLTRTINPSRITHGTS